jgi:glycosyltransferase involved in cell wall biosynthesis
MPSVVLIVPGSLDTRTGGYGYDRRIMSGLRDRGWTVDARELDGSFPFPTSRARAEASHLLAAIPDGATVLVDGLALGALPIEIEREAPRLRIVGLVHHPLAAETGIAEDVAAALEISERGALAAVRAVVVTSRATARVLQQRYAVAASRITVVEPGTDPAPLGRGASPEPPISSPFSRDLLLLCVATLTPRKGHDLLFRALASIPQRNWQLICAGSLDRDRETTARLRAQLRADGLEDRVRLAGDLDAAALDARYAAADLFVLATRHEGYGMAVAEALARGLPVISTATGAIEELVAGSDPPAGIVLPPGDLDALSQALARALGDADLRARLAHGARLARERLPRWDDSCAKMAAVLDRASRAHDD